MQAGDQTDLPSDYIDKVIGVLLAGKEKFGAEHRKEVTAQVSALWDLQLVIASRLKPESSALQSQPTRPEPEPRAAATAIAFGTSLDDDEAVLRLMHAVDKDGGGTISEAELLESPLLKREENKEMRRAIRAAFGCDLAAMEEALALLDGADFGSYAKKGSDGAFDGKAAVRAVFDAAVLAPAGEAEQGGDSSSAQPPSGEQSSSDPAREVSSEQSRDSLSGRQETGTGTSGRVPDQTASERATKAGVERLAKSLKEENMAKLSAALAVLAEGLVPEGLELDFLAIKRAARRVPRVSGPRVQWVSSVGLDAALARHLPAGTLEDGLAGVRGMPEEAAARAFDAFVEDARAKFLAALREARETTGSKSAAEANSKFEGFQGSFATLQDFHAGAEATLKLGYPNPEAMKGIRLEHTAHPSIARLFITPNYRIATSLLVEYAWAVLEESPTDPAAQALQARARAQLVKLAAARRGERPERAPTTGEAQASPVGAGSDAAAAAAAASPAEVGAAAGEEKLLFPGEVGDSFAETFVLVRVPGVGPAEQRAEAAKRCEAAATALLETEEEKVRGVVALDHEACAARVARGASVRDAPSGGDAALDGELLVGVLFPWSSQARAEAARAALRDAVAAAVEGGEGVVAEVAGYTTWSFSEHAGLQGLRKWLGEKSLDDLRAMVPAAAERGEEWADLRVEGMGHEALCSAVAGAFVRTELRADLRAALEHASEAQVLALLDAWRPGQGGQRGGARAEWIEEAVAALDSEERWKEVEGWVRLHRGRIQGRTRLGLKALMEREKDKITRYGLKEAEVLALHLYTGARSHSPTRARFVG